MVDKCDVRKDKELCCGCDFCGRMTMLQNMTMEEYENYTSS